jgi:chromosome segregation ATPase
MTSTVLQSSISTADQFEKTVRALQRKLNNSENDVKAHQDVINKLEVQLTRAEAVVRDNKKQLDSLSREKTTVSSELSTLRAEVSNLRSQMEQVEQVKSEERTTLQKQLDTERRYKEKAERARVILENRMEELMSKKSKFMCF